MDSSTRLDYFLFQLTPTRTRCDLVIFAGKSNEKLAYGLLEPFVAHLQSAKDQISKGGYSITLRPPSPSIAPWFTKATLQRFVRFVSTPEVLERFVTIEKEIAQLENSIKSYEASSADGGLRTESEGNATAAGGDMKNSGSPFKLKGESGDSSDALQEENSKVRLQRVVETRKAVLRKEQAMVYARALAAGFEMNTLDDLISFSDAFKASRLREACLNFKDLCKKKNEDMVWVDEIAAMQAIVQPELSYLGTSGIVLTEDNDPTHSFTIGRKQSGSTDVLVSESITNHGGSDTNQDNGSALPTDAKVQVPNPWANQFPPYLQNFPGPVYQQMPPYQGYIFPGMQVAPPYYPSNMQWPSNTECASLDHRIQKKYSRKKDKGSNWQEIEEQGSSAEASGSSSESETDSSSERSHRKKHGKNSSRKVVIRNINYITSKRDGERNGASEMDSSAEDGDSLKDPLENAVGSFENHQRSSSRHHRKQEGSKHLSSVNGSFDQHDMDSSSKNNKGNENWDALQQLLLREESDSKGPDPQSTLVGKEYFSPARYEEQNSYTFKLGVEKRAKRKPGAADAFIVAEKATGCDVSMDELSVEKFDPSESLRSAMKSSSTPEEFLLSQRTDDPEQYMQVALSDDTACSSVIKSHMGDDWFISKSNVSVNQIENNLHRLIVADDVRSSGDQAEKKRKDAIVDDSFMIQGRLTDDNPESQLRTNISLVSDIVETSFIENGPGEVPQMKSESLGFYEPDDIYMVLDRETIVEQSVPTWTPEMDYENNVSLNEPVKRHYEADVNATNSNLTSKDTGLNKVKGGASATKVLGKDARSRIMNGPLRKGKTETTPSNRRSTFGSKTTSPRSHLEKEEERRKRMEELVLQRQRRIAERSANSGGKAAAASLSSEKLKLQPSPEKAKMPKPILRLSTIERLAAAKTVAPAPAPAPAPPKKPVSKVNRGL